MNRILYYIAFILTILLKLTTSSTLINIDPVFNKLLIFVICILFGIKIILDKHNIKDLFIIFISSLLFIYVYLKTDASFLLITYLAFIGVKNISVRTIIKIDLIVKAAFLVSHLLIFSLDYLFYSTNVLNFIKVTSKGTSYYLYFSNPNAVGAITFIMLLDYFYLNKNNNIKKYTIPSIIMFLCFAITRSRTPFFLYIIYLLLQLIKNDKIITIGYKIVYPLLSILSIIMISKLSITSNLFFELNKNFSGRLYYSYSAFSEYGFNILPNINNIKVLNNFIIDNFFVRCFILYGFVTLVFMYLPRLIKNNSIKVKKMTIVNDIYLFFECVSINLGYSPIYILLGDNIINGGNYEK